MATNQTTNYQLNQWEPTDAVQRVDFNADNAKLDTALKSLSDQVVQKASQSALNTVISAVNQKADAATVSSLSSQLSTEISQRQMEAGELQSCLLLKGNCEIYHTSYVGDGTNIKSFTFPHKPLLVLIMGDYRMLMAIHGTELVLGYAYDDAGGFSPATWEGNTLSWNMAEGSGGVRYGLNVEGNIYHMIALMSVDA